MRFILYLLFMTTAFTATGQTQKFDELTNNLLLRIPTQKSDSATTGFLKKYVPFLVTKSEPGGWSAYPPEADTTPDVLTIHSYIFEKHPFIDIDMQEGRLDLLTREKNGKLNGLRTYYVTFIFNSKQKAEQEFEKICKQYDSVSTSKKVIEKGGKKVAAYNADSGDKWLKQVEFILTQDELFDDKYKIIFGTILDPMFRRHYGVEEEGLGF